MTTYSCLVCGAYCDSWVNAREHYHTHHPDRELPAALRA